MWKCVAIHVYIHSMKQDYTYIMSYWNQTMKNASGHIYLHFIFNLLYISNNSHANMKMDKHEMFLYDGYFVPNRSITEHQLGSFSWWRHQMETFPGYWPFVRGINRSPVNSPHKGRWRGALMFSLICAWMNGWVHNREAGDLRRHRAHYDVIAMWNQANYSFYEG